jgi:hypothetical protein
MFPPAQVEEFAAPQAVASAISTIGVRWSV